MFSSGEGIITAVRDVPYNYLINNTHHMAFWLFIDPNLTLKELGYDTERMVVADANARHSGEECLRLSVPHRNHGISADVPVAQEN